MAKRKHKSRRKHRTGSVITTRRLNGVGNLKSTNSFVGAFVPPVIGGGVTGGTALAVQHFTAPGAGAMGMAHDWSPVVGMAAGGLSSLALKMLVGTPQALASLGSSLIMGAVLLVDKYLDAPAATSGLGRGRRRHMGAIVAEQMAGLPAGGVGAIVMTPAADMTQSYGYQGGGETVSLGSINPAAFGTPGFQM
jgi:hypothetical protein